MGQVLADTGEVHRARGNSRVALLSQEFGVKPENTLREELSSGFASVVQVMKEGSWSRMRHVRAGMSCLVAAVQPNNRCPPAMLPRR